MSRFMTEQLTETEAEALKMGRGALFADHGADAHDLFEVAATAHYVDRDDPYGSTMHILFDLAEALWRYGYESEMTDRRFRPGLGVEEGRNEFDDLLFDGCEPEAVLDFFDYMEVGRRILVAHGMEY